MICEIITIGDELLIGMTVDTNSNWMASELTSAGIPVRRIISIPDERDYIIDTLDASLRRSDLVLVTGGLGPTSDDVTKQALADLFNTKLIFSDEVFNSVKELLKK